MNQTFSGRRWGLLVRKHWAEQGRRYLLSLAAIGGLMLLWFVFILLTDRYDPMAPGLQQITFFMSLFLVGPFFANQYFRDLGSRSRAINLLMTPASNLEKCLCGLFYTLLLFFVVFVALFYVVDALAVAIANQVNPFYSGALQPDASVGKARIINVFKAQGGSEQMAVHFAFVAFLLIQSAAFLGSVYFTRYSYIKTAIAITLLLFVVFLVETYLLSPILPKGHFYRGLTSYWVQDGSADGKIVTLPNWAKTSLSFLAQYAVAPLLWVVAYYRLKEKEV